jgi:hypothetical protein
MTGALRRQDGAEQRGRDEPSSSGDRTIEPGSDANVLLIDRAQYGGG